MRSAESGGGIVALNDGGPAPGLLAGARYAQASVVVGGGVLLVLYSDGIVEAANGAGEEFGDERLRAVLRNARESPLIGRPRPGAGGGGEVFGEHRSAGRPDTGGGTVQAGVETHADETAPARDLVAV